MRKRKFSDSVNVDIDSKTDTSSKITDVRDYMKTCLGMLSNNTLDHDVIFSKGGIYMGGGALLACTGNLGFRKNSVPRRSRTASVRGLPTIDPLLPLDSDIDLFVRGTGENPADRILSAGDALCDLLQGLPPKSLFSCDESTVVVSVPGSPRPLHIVYAPDIFTRDLFAAFDFPFLRIHHDGFRVLAHDSMSRNVALSATDQLSPAVIERVVKYRKRGYSFSAIDQDALDAACVNAEASVPRQRQYLVYSTAADCIRKFAFHPTGDRSYKEGILRISPRLVSAICTTVPSIPVDIATTIIAEYCSEFAGVHMTASQSSTGTRICRRYSPGRGAELLRKEDKPSFLVAAEEFVRFLRCTNQYIDHAFGTLSFNIISIEREPTCSHSIQYIDLLDDTAVFNITCPESSYFNIKTELEVSSSRTKIRTGVF